jgi:hypothetical protein
VIVRFLPVIMNSETTGTSASSVMLTGPRAAREIATQLENLDDKQALPEVGRTILIKIRKSYHESL